MLQNTNTMETLQNILIVDDEVNVCRGVQRIFDEEGIMSNYALTGAEGLKKAEEEEFDLVITDLKMPDISGLDMIKTLKQRRPDTPVVMITGYASVPTAVEAMKIGAYDYIPKPFDPDEILRVVHEAMEKNRREKAAKAGENRCVKVEDEKIIEKDQVLAVLTRTNRDMKFWRTIWEKGSKALNGFRLSNEARAAITAGDVTWIRNNYEWNDGELTEEILKPVEHFLEIERW